MRKYLLILVLVFSVVWPKALFGQYASHDELSKRIKRLNDASDLVTAETMGRSAGGRPLWLIRVSAAAEPDKQPGYCILGGVDGSRLYTLEMAMRMAERLSAAQPNDSVHNLLKKVTFYIFPNLSPDATEQYFVAPAYARNTNDQPTDDDKDALTDEDPFEDLNNDGMISQMLVEDPTGTYIQHPFDNRVIVLADLKKGERGRFRLLTEGIDNDADGKFNEDPQGGANPNQNFTYAYPNFQTGAGQYPTSAPETRMLVEYLFKAPNIYALLVLGPQQNLVSAPQGLDLKRDPRATSKPNEDDAKTYKMLAEWYKNAVAPENAPDFPKASGDVMNWGYYHYGRLSMGTPAWWTPKPKYVKNPNLTDAENKKQSQLIENENEQIRLLQQLANDPERLRWAINWSPVKHPQFPGQTVLVGGVHPFLVNNPPFGALDSLSFKHFNFLYQSAQAFPRLAILNARSEQISQGLYRLTVSIANTGLLPTHTEEGADNQYTQRIVYRLKLSNGQELYGGYALGAVATLKAGASEEKSWIISGGGSVSLSVENPFTGTVEQTITLGR